MSGEPLFISTDNSTLAADVPFTRPISEEHGLSAENNTFSMERVGVRSKGQILI